MPPTLRRAASSRAARVALVGATVFLASSAATFAVMRSVRREPEVTVEPAVVDFGPVEHEHQLDATFVVRNNGRNEVVLDRFAPSCGCMTISRVAEGGKSPVGDSITLGPGESVTLHTGMTSGTMQGPVSGLVEFRTSSEEVPSVRFEMRAELHGRLHAVPSSLNAGSGPAGEPKRLTFVLTDGGLREPFVLSRFDCTIPSASVSGRPIADPSAAGVGGRPLYEVTVDLANTEAGPIRGEVRAFAEGSSTPDLVVPVAGEVLPRWRASPPSAVFPLRGAEDPFAVEVRLNGHDGRPAAFDLDAGSVPDWLTADLSTDGDARILRLSVPPDRRGPSGTARVLLRPAAPGPDAAPAIALPVFLLPDPGGRPAPADPTPESR